ncbi:MAG TPA: hypothetical protein VGC53_16425 [Vicinamibacteria bacterium]|jgi:hypothetical protein
MKVLTATVVDGRLELPKGTLHDGDTVTLLVPDREEKGFHLSDDQQADLRAAIAEADRGEIVEGPQLPDEIKR